MNETRTTPQNAPTPLDTAELLEKLQEIDENTEWDNLSGSAVFTPEEYGEIVHRVTVHAALVEALEEVLPLLSQINLSSEGMRGEATERAESIARAALAAAKEPTP